MKPEAPQLGTCETTGELAPQSHVKRETCINWRPVAAQPPQVDPLQSQSNADLQAEVARLTAENRDLVHQLECSKDVREHEQEKLADLLLKATAENQRLTRELGQPIKIEIYQHDWMPGFAAFLDDGAIAEGATAHVSLNVGAFIAACKTGDLAKSEVPYFVAESIMHEVVHVLESWAGVEFSEDRVEELLTKYREKYERATIWKYTGGEPELASGEPQGETKS